MIIIYIISQRSTNTYSVITNHYRRFHVPLIDMRALTFRSLNVIVLFVNVSKLIKMFANESERP